MKMAIFGEIRDHYAELEALLVYLRDEDRVDAIIGFGGLDLYKYMPKFNRIVRLYEAAMTPPPLYIAPLSTDNPTELAEWFGVCKLGLHLIGDGIDNVTNIVGNSTRYVKKIITDNEFDTINANYPRSLDTHIILTTIPQTDKLVSKVPVVILPSPIHRVIPSALGFLLKVGSVENNFYYLIDIKQKTGKVEFWVLHPTTSGWDKSQ